MEKLLLGIDIGTSACKVAIFGRKGNVLAQSNQGYQLYYPNPGWVEQNPDEWFQSICIAIKDALEKGKIHPSQIAGIGIDGQSWSVFRWIK